MNHQSKFLADVIKILHIGLIAFIVIIPLLKKSRVQLLLLHCVMVASLLIHWLLNEDACFLTFLESSLRGIPTTSSFMHQLVNPIYKIEDADVKKFLMFMTPALGYVSLKRLFHLWKISQGDLTQFLML